MKEGILMLYKYEMHVHDSLCSHCGHNPPEVIAKVYYDRGYAGSFRACGADALYAR